MRARHPALSLAALIMAAGLAGCASSGANTPAAAAWGEPQFAAWQETDPAYRFYPGDSIEVTVHSAPELSRTVRIGPDGRVSLPLLPDVMVAGQADYEIANTVADAYARDVLVSPVVEVRRAELGPQNIVVGGEVNGPGLIAMHGGPIGALEAVMLAGGFKNTAARGEVVVLRRQPGGGLMMRTVNLRNALDARPGADNIQIRRHDIVFVPRSSIAEVTDFVEQYVYGILPLDQAFSYAIADAINDN